MVLNTAMPVPAIPGRREARDAQARTQPRGTTATPASEFWRVVLARWQDAERAALKSRDLERLAVVREMIGNCEKRLRALEAGIGRDDTGYPGMDKRPVIVAASTLEAFTFLVTAIVAAIATWAIFGG